MAKKENTRLRKFHPSAVKMAQTDGKNLVNALAEATAPAAGLPANGAAMDSAAPGDTPSGIRLDYEGPEDSDLPVGALPDSQVIALIKNVLLRGGIPAFYRFHNQIFLRVATAE